MLCIQAILGVLLIFTISSCYGLGGTISLVEPTVIGKTLGNKCKKTTPGVTNCNVKGGDSAVLAGSVNITSDGSQGINTLACSLTLTGENDIVTKAPTCLGTGGHLVIKGDCSVRVIAASTYSMDPFAFTLPKPTSKETKVLTMVCDSVWSDNSQMNNLEAGTVNLMFQ